MSLRDWVKRLREFLEEMGLSFEVEEGVRIHLDDVVLEVREEREGLVVDASASLPGEAPSEEEVEGYAESLKRLLLLASKIGGELRYELDTSLPGYPMLHLAMALGSPAEGVNKLVEALRSLVERGFVGSTRVAEEA